MERALEGQPSPSSALLQAALSQRHWPARLHLACGVPFSFPETQPTWALPSQRTGGGRQGHMHAPPQVEGLAWGWGKCRGSRGSPSPELEASDEGSQVRGQVQTRPGLPAGPALATDLTVPAEARGPGSSTAPPFRSPPGGLRHRDALYRQLVAQCLVHARLCRGAEHEAWLSGSQRDFRAHKSFQGKAGHAKHCGKTGGRAGSGSLRLASRTAGAQQALS